MRNDLFKDASFSPLQRLRNYFDAVERLHLAEAPLAGCLFGVLSQTAAARSPEFRARLARVFTRWEVQLRALLEEGQAIGEVDSTVDTKETAAFLIDCYEGTLVRRKVDGDRNAFRRFRRLALEPLGITARPQR
jgi:TetR/AcrR family transcriptional repressor of nem operon